MKERKAYVVLVAIAAVLSAGNILFTIVRVSESNHKFCTLINVSLSDSGPVPKPADPKADPKKEKSYEDYEIVVNLGHGLGCL
jgi:hypothetical protein